MIRLYDGPPLWINLDKDAIASLNNDKLKKLEEQVYATFSEAPGFVLTEKQKEMCCFYANKAKDRFAVLMPTVTSYNTAVEEEDLGEVITSIVRIFEENGFVLKGPVLASVVYTKLLPFGEEEWCSALVTKDEGELICEFNNNCVVIGDSPEDLYYISRGFTLSEMHKDMTHLMQIAQDLTADCTQAKDCCSQCWCEGQSCELRDLKEKYKI